MLCSEKRLLTCEQSSFRSASLVAMPCSQPFIARSPGCYSDYSLKAAFGNAPLCFSRYSIVQKVQLQKISRGT